MLAPRWRKVVRDLAHDRTRTVLVVLSIAIGVFVFGTILAGATVLSRELSVSFLATNPPSAILTLDTFDYQLVDSVRRLPGVAQAQGRRAVPARVQTGPTTWQDMLLYVLPDDGVTEVSIVQPSGGAWPAPDRTVLIERASLAKTGANVGDTIHVALPGKYTRDIPIAGLTHDLSLPPAIVAGQVFGYINATTLEWLGGQRGYNQLAIVVSGDRTDEAHIRNVVAPVEQLIVRGGRTVLSTEIPPPLQHPVQAFLPTIMTIMILIGSLALLISIFLIINTISAILMQQTRQIGIMMALGATARQLSGVYFAFAAAFGALALLIAIPLSIFGAYGLASFLANQLNVDIVGFRMPPAVLAVEIGAALLVPMAAAFFPIRGVVSQPAREAIAGTTTAPVEETPADRIIARIQRLGRPTRLALRNTFRRRGRLVRTLIALALGGAVFVSAMTLRSSLFTTLDESIASQLYDVEIQFNRLYRSDEVKPVVAAAPGVTNVESLLRSSVFPVRPDGAVGEEMNLRAVPATTTMFAPRMVDGRWLVPNDDRAIVLSSNVLQKIPGTRVGDEITLRLGDKDYGWRIVGLVEELIPPTSPVQAYVPIDAFTQAAGLGIGRTDTLRVATVGHDASSHRATVADLEQRLDAAGFDVRLVRSRSEDRAILADRFNLVSIVMSIMSLLIAIVGGLGLAGTMSMNVLERMREIGVMRAIGATDGAIRQIVLSEGLVIAALAWLIATLMSLPMSYAMSFAIGRQLLSSPLIWTYAFAAVAFWLLVVLVIAVVASLLPARTAVELTVRETLTYE